MQWQADGSVGFRANNGKYIGAKRSGHLYANCDASDENAKFFFYLINRWGSKVALSAHANLPTS